MTKDEAAATAALKLALEALSILKPANWLDAELQIQAWEAIKEALTSTQCEKQPVQGPDEISTEELIYAAGVYDGKKQRPWVGLTQQEENEIWKSSRGVQETITKTQAKLKEKNT